MSAHKAQGCGNVMISIISEHVNVKLCSNTGRHTMTLIGKFLAQSPLFLFLCLSLPLSPHSLSHPLPYCLLSSIAARPPTIPIVRLGSSFTDKGNPKSPRMGCQSRQSCHHNVHGSITWGTQIGTTFRWRFVRKFRKGHIVRTALSQVKQVFS
jgi:hypothetical protein